jgi:hypothetical protein
MFTRKPVTAAVSLLLIAIVVGGILLNFGSADATVVNPLPPPQNHPHIYFNDGAPAIPAHPGNTLLSVADVEHYVLTHRCPVGPTVSGGLPKIMAIQLMTSRNASKVMGGEYVGPSDDALVYYVLLKGPFIPEFVITVAGVDPGIADTMDEVFDAYTGNQLLWGA